MLTDGVTAIDFETANQNFASACAIGMVKIRNGEVCEDYYSLVKPPRGMRISTFNQGIHGISNDDVKNAPNFAEIWGAVRDFIGDDVLCAHNARFDSGVFNATLDYYRIERRNYRFVCTLEAARRIWRKPDVVENHRLNTLCDFLNIRLNHHNALSDAEACARLWLIEQKAAEERRFHD